HPHCVTQIRASGGISARALCPASPAYTVSWPDGYDRGPTGTVAACGSGRAEAAAGRRARDLRHALSPRSAAAGDAVDPSASGIEFAGIDPDDLPARIHALEHGGRLGGHGSVEGAREDPAVGDEMIDIGVVDEALVVAQHLGGGDRHDVEGHAVGGGLGGEELLELATEFEVRMLRIALIVDEDDPWAGHRGDDVDVAARAVGLVVPVQPVVEPDDLLRPDGAGEFGFDLVLAD